MTPDKTDLKEHYWKSIKEYYKDPEVLQAKLNEFAKGVTDEFSVDKLNGLSRRRFIALLSASAALAATACSDYRDKGEIIPYTNRPEGVLPGKPDYYSSFVNDKSVLIKVREGRPINIVGNPDHPVYKGKLDAQTPATLLNLYDPERLKEPTKDKLKIDWAKADAEIIDALTKAAADGKEIALIGDRITSPSVMKLFADFKKKYSTARVYSYKQISDENKRIAWDQCFGTRNIPSVKLNNANVILAIESDFLGREGNTIEKTRMFAESRDIINNGKMSRLYAAEGSMSLTGMNADYRLRIRSDYHHNFILSLINELIGKGMTANADKELRDMVSSFPLDDFVKRHGLDALKISYLVKDLLNDPSGSIVLGGESLPVEVHTAINLLNNLLGNDNLFDYSSVELDHQPLSTDKELDEFIERSLSGEVGVIINFGVNPVYHLPSSLGIEKVFSEVNTTISIVESDNETSALSNYVLPSSHALESWGDNFTRSNIYELQQPVISPIFNTRQKEAVLLSWINGISEAYSDDAFKEYLMDVFEENVFITQNPAVDFKSYWYNSLHNGFAHIKSGRLQPGTFKFNPVRKTTNADDYDYVLHLTPNYFIGDGRYANNGWLQEMPHPVSKISWDNYAAVSPSSAKKLGVENDDLVKIKTASSFLEIPVFIQPGMADGQISIELGYGRTVIGDVGKNSGFNAAVLQESLSSVLIAGVTLEKSSGSYKLVSTQEHHSLDDDSVKDFHKMRHIIQEGTFKKYKEDPGFLHEEKHKLKGITREHKYEGLKWGMSIDLNKCISCGSCVSACNVENNIPVVGKDQVELGREMHWIRIDRYYSGTPDEPEVSNQPMLCQHCDNAPCENVCPVNATNHSPDGLNQMAYNRCVGTRYCANNCPYKVRRFNFYNFRDHFADAYYQNELSYLANNPEVTVRSRGVMEKCTFCVQRIMDAREEAIREGREIKGSDVVTACQSVCPGNAIVFGDINDPESEVSKYRTHELGYHVLEELYVKPNVTYIAKLRNTHAEEA
ncbi:MAG: TAT-variant-translocated molybdopterin oxidoreductase [Melioribacteraceae bacterium]|nr:TAT-variant-translocated molybdopterin oxidoreductase [Melioribacteraceae bacterium]